MDLENQFNAEQSNYTFMRNISPRGMLNENQIYQQNSTENNFRNLKKDLDDLLIFQTKEHETLNILNDKLRDIKLFFSMVIHDMRSPTSAI